MLVWISQANVEERQECHQSLSERVGDLVLKVAAAEGEALEHSTGQPTQPRTTPAASDTSQAAGFQFEHHNMGHASAPRSALRNTPIVKEKEVLPDMVPQAATPGKAWRNVTRRGSTDRGSSILRSSSSTPFKKDELQVARHWLRKAPQEDWQVTVAQPPHIPT